MNKDKLKQVAKELKGASKKHSGQADKIMSAIKQKKHPFYPLDDPQIADRIKKEEEDDFKRRGREDLRQYSDIRKGLKDKSDSSLKLKDACYYKAKRAHKVFPSAYASGMIAKCRKVGAANFGKSKKKKK